MMTKPYIEAILYQIGDKVVRMNQSNGLESKITGLDYSKILTVKAVVEKQAEDYRFLLLQFEGSESWHPAIDYLPADKKIRNEVMQDCLDVFRQRRAKSSSRIVKTDSSVVKEDSKKVEVTKSIFKKK